MNKGFAKEYEKKFEEMLDQLEDVFSQASRCSNDIQELRWKIAAIKDVIISLIADLAMPRF